jgi:hypothetical protein
LAPSTEGGSQDSSAGVADLLEARADAGDVPADYPPSQIVSMVRAEQSCHIAMLAVSNIRRQVVASSIEEEGDPDSLLSCGSGILVGDAFFRNGYSPGLVGRLARK